MGGFFNCLNNNSGAFQVLFSAIVAFSTMVYAYFTWRLVSETRRMRKIQTTPEVCAYIQAKPGWIGEFFPARTPMFVL